MTNELFSTGHNPETDQSDQTMAGYGRSVYIPLNRLNLIPVVSTGLIRPARAYNKYYEDILGIRDDLIPLFQAAPGQELTGYCATEGVNAFPVILELSEDTFTTAELEAGATFRPIPATRLLAVHCRTEAEARELVAHTWENASLNGLPVDVLPELFNQEGEQPEDLRRRLISLPKGDPDLFDRLSAASRITGGLVAVAGLGEEQQHWAESLLVDGQADEETSGLRMIRRALLNDVPASGEERLLSGMVHALVRLGFPSRESTEQLLGIYRAQAAEDFPEDGRIQKTVERAQHVLIRHDIRPGDDSSAPVSFGLLLHALRSRLSELTPERSDWATFFEAGLPRPDTLAVARFLTGMRTGRHRLDTADRLPELDRLAASWEARAAVNPEEPLLACRRKQITEVSVTTVEETVQAAEITEDALLPSPEPVTDSPANEAASPASVQEAERDSQSNSETDSPEETRIPGFDEQSDDFRVAVCTLRGWVELLAVQVQLSGSSSMELIPGRGSNTTLLLPHDAAITRIIRDQEKYRLRLEEHPLSLEDLSLIRNLQQPEPVKRRGKTSGKSTTRKNGRKKGKDPEGL